MSVSDKINASAAAAEALLDYANEVTGAGDENLGDAVRSLADGYGKGVSENAIVLSGRTGVYNSPTEVDLSSLPADLGGHSQFGFTTSLFGPTNETSNGNAYYYVTRAKIPQWTSLGELFCYFHSLMSVDGAESVTGLSGSTFRCCTALRKVWIRSSVQAIQANNINNAPFRSCNAELVLYCEADSKPVGWGSFFDNYSATSKLRVVWGQKTSPFADGEDTVIIGHGD